jgi:hypothetical protein
MEVGLPGLMGRVYRDLGLSARLFQEKGLALSSPVGAMPTSRLKTAASRDVGIAPTGGRKDVILTSALNDGNRRHEHGHERVHPESRV